MPQIRDLPSGVRVASVSIATNHVTGGSVVTQWHNVQIFDGVSGFPIVAALQPGTQLYVEGALRISTVEKDGVNRQFVNISVTRTMGMFRVLRRPYKQQSSGDIDPMPNTTESGYPF